MSQENPSSACFLNLVTTRRCQSVFPNGLNEDQQGYHWHSMGDMLRSDGNHKPTFDGRPLLVEAAPMMAPRFEHTLHRLIRPTLESGYPVAVFCLPSMRRVTQKATWADHWNRRFRTHFSFVQRCLCAFDPASEEHRTLCIGTNMPLPNKTCDALPLAGSTKHMGRVATVTALLALVGILGCPVRVWGSPALIPQTRTRHRGRVPNPTKLNTTSTTLTTMTPPQASKQLQPLTVHPWTTTPVQQDSVDHTQQAFPTDAKEKEGPTEEAERRR